MPDMNYQRKLRTCKHECGHAVVTLATGHSFTDIEIGGDLTIDRDQNEMATGNKASGVIRGMGQWMGDRTYVVALMAGLAGTRVNRKKPGRLTFVDILSGAEGDWLEAKPLVPGLIEKYEPGMNFDQYLNWSLAQAHRIIVKYRDAHTAMVEALMAKGKLTYEECRSIWETNRGEEEA